MLQTSDVLSYPGGLPLRIDPASAAFSRVSESGARLGVPTDGQAPSPVSGGVVRVSWPVGGGAPVVDLTRDAFAIQAFAPADTKVHAARAMTIAGVLSATAGMTFTLVGTGNGMVVPTIATNGFRPRKPLEPQRCKDFTLGDSKLDGRAGLPTSKSVEERRLRAGDIPIAATADGEPVLDLSLANHRATVLEERGGRTRIAIEASGGNVVGWVLSTDLVREAEPPHGIGLEAFGSWGPGTMPRPSSSPPETAEYVCEQDVPLYVDMTDGSVEDLLRLPYARVGTVQKKRAFKVSKGQGGLDRVAGQKVLDLVFTEPGRLSVATEDLEKACRQIPGKRREASAPRR